MYSSRKSPSHSQKCVGAGREGYLMFQVMVPLWVDLEESAV
jgi:hypothetical protein